ncbi:MAG TPA: hypothetical protein VG095_06990 [Chthoniobacterales bacterium]|nr:hypothetical protein [Chthoniobacterales bacterium]
MNLAKALRSSSSAAVLLITTAAFALYGDTLRGYFLGDDFGYVWLFRNFSITRWPGLFVNEWSQGLWGYNLPELRPFAALAFMVDGKLWGGNASGYRITNFALHVLCSWMVFAFARRALLLGGAVAAAAGLLFAVHPAHVEPVVWITGRVDLLPTAFVLAGLLAFAIFRQSGTRWALVLCWACYFAAAFSKEYGLVLPLLTLAYDLTCLPLVRRGETGARGRWLRQLSPYLGFIAVLAIYYLCRSIAFANATATAGSSGELRHVVAQQVEYWRYLLSIEPLAGAWLWAWRSGASTTLLALCAVGLLAVFTAVALLRAAGPAGSRRLLFSGPLWFVLTTLPFAISYISARHLYLASAGFSIFVAGAVLGTKRRAWLGWVVLAGVAVLWSYQGFQRTRVWREAGAISREVNTELRRLSNLPRGSVLLLHLPSVNGEAPLFVWSSPFLIDRPFLKPSLRRRVRVLEPPPNYQLGRAWVQKREIARIAELPENAVAYELGYDFAARRVTRRPLDPHRLRSAAQTLREEAAREPGADPVVLWQRFHAAL